MKPKTLNFIFCFAIMNVVACSPGKAQSYDDSIKKYRQNYIKELHDEPRKPIAPGDDRYIHFFPADKKYCVWADFTPTPGATPFLVNTHSGKQKPFKEYGTLSFKINDTALVLHVYQSVDMVNDMAHKDDLFVPFNDETNYYTTFAGGRYIDLSVKDIVNNKILIDFNKCYNPYCAYTDGFSCPIPPAENNLHVSIIAGEKMFTKNTGD